MNGRKHISLPLLLLGACLVFLVIAPLATVFVKALIINDHLDFSFAAAALSEPQNARMIRNSLLLGLAVVILSSLISIPLAYLFSRTQLGQHKIFDLLFLIPFMTPPYIASMGWILFMQKRGLFSQMVPAFPNGIPLFFTFGGLVLVMSLHIFPFMMVLMKNAMLHIPSSLEEAAAISGAGYGRRLRKIFFPLLTGNYVIGALLVFVKTLSEYGTPYTLGRRIGFDVFTTDIHRYAAVAPIDFGKAAVLASVLVTICMVLWLVQNYITVHHSYNLISGKGSRMRIHRLSSPGKVLAILYIGLILVISIGIPYFSVISTSLIRLRGFGLAAGNFTFHHYVELFTDSETALPAIGNSFLLGLLSATICAILGTVIVLSIRAGRSRFGKVLEAMSLLPEMLPGIVLVIGLMLFWNDIYDILPLYNTMGIMVITYTALFLPYTVQYVTSASTQLSESLLEAGRVFGGSRYYIFRHITCPLIARGMAAGWMMTFIIAIRELVAPSLIAPPDTLVISTYIMREFEQGSVSLGMSMAVLCILLTTLSLAGVKLLTRNLK
ncbi:iron ABC transporter permease [Dialister sp.]|jgi:iron(III) transport system permease protein|uniref:ABC transporter permease n=3 Tax=Dialister TaxID=39948 RepID=UPI0025E99C91|nr:iron ABC transporter permease [Dialister sp.]